MCGSRIHEVLYTQRFEPFAAGSITSSYDVVACQGCGTSFASGLPSQARFDEYYDQSSKYDLSAAGAAVSQFEARRYEDEATFIAAHVADRAGAILDVGAATGSLLVALRDAGFTNLHGVEPSSEAARRAREEHGLDVVAGDVSAARRSGAVFSAVTLVAVLEHLVEPAQVLVKTAELLAPGGLLYLVVPDAAGFAEHVDAPFQQFSVEHINYFTPASMRNLLAAAELEVVVERTSVLRQSDDSDGPILEVLCRRSDGQPSMKVDASGVESLRRYIATCTELEERIREEISRLADGQQPMYVWGTGTNALHLLVASRLRECNIVAFLDSNPHYVGRELAGRPVLAPSDLAHVDAPILVASAVSQTAIAQAARQRFGPDVPLILMYRR